MSKTIVAIDAMGGDNAPVEIVKGAIESLSELNVEIILVGQVDAIKSELANYTYDEKSVSIVEATEIISSTELPTTAIREKKNSSMVVGLKLVKDGKANAFISAGSTGALLVGATVKIGKIKGIERPALGASLPTKTGYALLLDSGANMDCKPKYIEQFAKMGQVYAQYVMNVENPKIGLLNVGEEEEKGDTLTKETFELLKQSDVNFCGNIEPTTLFEGGSADVVVCDGFAGNILLKTAEAISKQMSRIVKTEITKGMYKFPALTLRKPFRNVKRKFDSDEVGGAPLLGLKSLVVKAHGNSKAKAIKNAIKQCNLFVENNIVEKIEEKI